MQRAQKHPRCGVGAQIVRFQSHSKPPLQPAAFLVHITERVRRVRKVDSARGLQNLIVQFSRRLELSGLDRSEVAEMRKLQRVDDELQQFGGVGTLCFWWLGRQNGLYRWLGESAPTDARA